MGFDGCRRTIYRYRFDHIRIYGALSEPFNILNFMRFAVKNLDKIPTNNFSFLLRFSNTFQVSKKFFPCLHANYIQSKVLIRLYDLLKFVFAEQSIIYKNTGNVLPNGFMNK